MPEAQWVYASAVLVALVHTLLGPDHYLPFAAMARAGAWSMRKTLLITALCGLGHVLGSVAIGCVGVAMGLGLGRLEQWQSWRGTLAGWLLLGFGLAYFVWGVRRAIRNQPHTHLHAHANGTLHAHAHTHHAEHLHAHVHSDVRLPSADAPTSTASHHPHRHSERSEESCSAARSPCVIGEPHATVASPSAAHSPPLAAWALFTIFLFGPCEPLIPLLMVPAAREDMFVMVLVVTLFSCTTIVAMLALVWLSVAAIALRPVPRLARFSHAAAGLVLTACGAGVTLGL